MAVYRRFRLWFGVGILGLLLIGCATTAGWSPGEPDEATIEHYALAQSAIAAKSIDDAQAALYLLRSDINRMRTSAPELMAALARVYEVNRAIERGDWEAARVRLEDLRVNYGRRRP
jgi:hypothetical protein